MILIMCIERVSIKKKIYTFILTLNVPTQEEISRQLR